MEDKKKREPTAWAKAVSEHMKAGGKFPKKGTEDYEKVKKLSDSMKTAAPAAVAAPAAAVSEKPKVKRGPYKKKAAVMESIPEKVEPVEVVKVKRTPVKKAAAVEPKKEEMAEAKPEPPLKAKRGPYKKKVVAKKDSVESSDESESDVEAAKKTDNVVKIDKADKIVMQHKMVVSESIPLARLQSMQGKTIPFMHFDILKR